MGRIRATFGKIVRGWIVASAATLVASCDQPVVSEGPVKGEWYTFSGDWAASGNRDTLHLGPEHQTSVFKLSGTMLVTGERILGTGFKVDAMGFSEGGTGLVGSSVWTNERGDQIFSTLKGEAIGTNKHIVGTFIGGSGRYAGASGEYEFNWQYVISAEQGAISGRAVGLKGRIRVGESGATKGQ